MHCGSCQHKYAQLDSKISSDFHYQVHSLPDILHEVNLIHTISLITARGNTLNIKASGSGQTIFLIHGFPLDHRMWIKQIEALSSRFQVVVPELRGFGGSSLDSDYSLADLAEDIEQVRRHLSANQPIDLIGLSMGGYVCFEYWRKYSSNLRSLVLSNTKPTADDEAARQGRIAMAEKALKEGSWAAVAPMLDKLIAAKSKGTAVEDAVKEMMESTSPAAVAAAQRAMAGRADFTALLASIGIPTLVITGEEDSLAPPATTRQWAGQIPGAQYVELAAGHLPTLEVPELFNSTITKFLTARSLT
jgi:3-oxoadipate enol-lactonase